MSGIPPVQPIDKCYRQKNPLPGMKKNSRKPVDKKILSVVLSKILSLTPASLFVSPVSQRVATDLVSTHFLPTKTVAWGRKRSAFQNTESATIPIGLLRCDLFPPLNAIFQLLLYFPVFRSAFSFTPDSFSELGNFIKQYTEDQQRKLPVSSADPRDLLEFLQQKMPAPSFKWDQAKVDIKGFLAHLIRAAFEQVATLPTSLQFLIDCNLTWNPQLPLSTVIDLPQRPADLFVTIERGAELNGASIPRQFFTKPDSYRYDLDAFIEIRLNDQNYVEYITYLKAADGGWIQCVDEKITPIGSNRLNTPLSRSPFLHYKRIWPK